VKVWLAVGVVAVMAVLGGCSSSGPGSLTAAQKSSSTTGANNGNRDAQSNLTNALTEAKALYQVNQAYENGGQPDTASDFSMQAPEFTWEVGAACPTTVVGCISVQVFDVAATGDSQGVALAVDSPETNTCWYAFDVEANPASPPLNAASTFATAGVFYGKQEAIPAGGCVALNPDTDSGITFAASTGTNYVNAPSIS
jgi:uncharacterized membrane protein YqiK